MHADCPEGKALQGARLREAGARASGREGFGFGFRDLEGGDEVRRGEEGEEVERQDRAIHHPARHPQLPQHVRPAQRCDA